MYKIGNYKISQNLAHTHTVLPPLNALRRGNYGGKMFHHFFGIFRDLPSYIKLFDLYLLN